MALRGVHAGTSSRSIATGNAPPKPQACMHTLFSPPSPQAALPQCRCHGRPESAGPPSQSSCTRPRTCHAAHTTGRAGRRHGVRRGGRRGMAATGPKSSSSAGGKLLAQQAASPPKSTHGESPSTTGGAACLVHLLDHQLVALLNQVQVGNPLAFFLPACTGTEGVGQPAARWACGAAARQRGMRCPTLPPARVVLPRSTGRAGRHLPMVIFSIIPMIFISSTCTPRVHRQHQDHINQTFDTSRCHNADTAEHSARGAGPTAGPGPAMPWMPVVSPCCWEWRS